MSLVPLTAACIAHVAVSFHLPGDVMLGILEQEAGRLGQVTRNTNGSVDIGPFQINSAWLPKLKQYFAQVLKDRGQPVTEDAVLALVRDDGCANAVAAGGHLRNLLDEAAGDVWLAVGRYHSRTPWRAEAYAERVKSRARKYRQS